MGPTKHSSVSGLRSQLASVSAERNILHDTLCQIQRGIQIDIESRLSRQAQNYEVRLTELHSVIAELKKQLDGQRSRIIPEDSGEDEEEPESATDQEQNDLNSNISFPQDSTQWTGEDMKKNNACAEVIENRSCVPITTELPRHKPQTVIIGCEKEMGCGESLDLNDKALEVCYIQAGEYLLSEVSTDLGSSGDTKIPNGSQAERQSKTRAAMKPGGTSTGRVEVQTGSSQTTMPRNKNIEACKATTSGRKLIEEISSESTEKVGKEQLMRRPEQETEPRIESAKTLTSFAALSQEVDQIRSEHIAIRKSLSQKEGELDRTKGALQNIARERDFLKNKVIELELMLSSSPTRSAQGLPRSQQLHHVPRDDEEELCTKVAEKVKLKPSSQTQSPEDESSSSFQVIVSPTTQGNILNNNHQVGDDSKNERCCQEDSSKPKFHPQLTYITGTELVKSVEPSYSTRVIEHLVRPLQDEARTREMEAVFANKALTGGSPEVNEDKIREFGIETERLQSRLEHLRAQNDVLTLNLKSAKGYADHLTVLLGKYESNNLALQMTLGYSDQAIEAYDVLVALLESELGQLLANCRAAGFGSPGTMVVRTEDCTRVEADDPELVTDLLQRAYENRYVAESAARTLLIRNMDSPNSENNNSNALLMLRFQHHHHQQHPSPPWEEASSGSQTLSSASSQGDHQSTSSRHSQNGDLHSPRRGNLEHGIRDWIIQLKTDRESVRTTISNLENDWNMEPEDMPPPSPCELIEARRLDLETAVLMQELMAMREERAELRASLFHGDKERRGLEMKLDSYETQTLAYKARINYLATELQELQSKTQDVDNIPNSDPEATDGNANLNKETCLASKEQSLKTKIEELVSTLERVGEATSERERQHSEMTMELKQANGMLIQTLESLKRKYQARIAKMEEQIMAIMQRHTTTVKLYKEKIHFLEMELRQ